MILTSPVICRAGFSLPESKYLRSISFAPAKPRFVLRAAGAFAGLTLFSLLYFPLFLDKEAPRLQFLIVFWYGLIALSAMAYARFCWCISCCDALYFTLAAFLSQNIIYCIIHCFAARELFPSLRSHLVLYVLATALFTALVYFILWYWFKKPLTAAGGHLLEDTPMALLSLAGLFLLVLILLFFYQSAFSARISFFDTMAWFSGVVVYVFFLIIQYGIVSGVVRSREKSILENMLRSSEKYYETSKEHIAIIINRKCHDLKHQLKALEKAGEEDRSEYIKEAQRSIDFYQSLVYSDNEALNTILAEKGLFCQEKEITFRCSVDDVDLSFIRLPDLYAILGNAIDNTIEYVETQTAPSLRAISMRIDRRGSMIGIQVINPYTGESLLSGDLSKTHKEDAANHGFGMKSIRYLAEKYRGIMEFSAEGGLFTLQIMIPAK